MKPFNHTNATSIAEVKTALADGKTTLIAGGTDLLGVFPLLLIETRLTNQGKCRSSRRKGSFWKNNETSVEST